MNQSSPLVLHPARHGDLFHLADDRVIGASLARYGEWAEQELWLMQRLVAAGATVVDVGANVGCHTLAFARFAGAEGRVISVEAQPAMFQVLAANVTVNCAPQGGPGCGATVHCVFALADRTSGSRRLPLDPAALGAPAGNYGAVSFAQPMAPAEGAGLPVAVLALDDLDLAQCALVKIDVEGMELPVLQGAQRLLTRCRPHVYFEQATDRQRGEIFALLRGHGYRLYWHVANPFNRANFNGARENIFGGACETNVLAVPTGVGVESELDLLAAGLVPVDESALPQPPAPASDAVRGWQLPPTAYARLPARPGIARWSTRAAVEAAHLRDQLQQVRAAFDALLEDRRKAQDVMDWQHRQLQALRQPA